ncbi:MAG: hypothetical protein Q9159_005946 [Coniocarpon cinnabarinum]
MRLFAFRPFIGPGVLITDGHAWRPARNLLQPAFTRAQIADLRLLKIHVDRLLAVLIANRGTIDLQPLFHQYGLDISSEFIFGKSVASLDPHTDPKDKERARLFLEAVDYCQTAVGKRMRLPHINILTLDPRFWQACRLVRSYIRSRVQQVTADYANMQSGQHSGSTRYILALELCKETKDEKVMQNQLLNVFIPAHGAAATTLMNCFFLLARHPKVYKKLRDEVLSTVTDLDENLQSSETIFVQLKALKYLQWVISETLRLHPPIGTISRVAKTASLLPIAGDDAIRRFRPALINKGDTVSVSLYALHRRTDIFGDDADSFRPERWQHLRPPYWAFAPFGGGPRHCPGQQLALVEISYTIATIVQTFSGIENRDPVKDFVERYRISTESRNGAKVYFPGQSTNGA